MNDRDLDVLYKRASAQDPARPSPAVRRAILEHAHQIAAQKSASADSATPTKIVSSKAGPIGRAARFFALLNRLGQSPRLHWQIVAPLVAAALAVIILQPLLRSTPPPAPSLASDGTPAERPAAPALAPAAPAGTAPVSSAPAAAAAPAPAPPAAPPLTANVRPAPEPFPAPPAPSGANAELAESAAGAKAAPSRAQSVPPTDGTANGMSAADLGSNAPVPAARALARQAQTPGEAQLNEARSADRASGTSISLANPLQQAAASGDVRSLSSLLRSRTIAINARDGSGRTALMLATLYRHSEAVAMLLERGADPNIADAAGRTPLEVAREGGQNSILSALTSAGAR